MNASPHADIAYPAIGGTRLRGLRDPVEPHVIVLFGATGDLARRKLLPGLLHLSLAGLIPDCRIVGTSLDDLDDEAFRTFAREAVRRVRQPRRHRRAVGRVRREAALRAARRRAPDALGEAVAEAEARARRRAPPAALPQRAAERGDAPWSSTLGEAGLVDALADHHGEAVRHRPGAAPRR